MIGQMIETFHQNLENFKVERQIQKDSDFFLMNIDLGFGLNEIIEIVLMVLKSEEKIRIELKKERIILKYLLNDLMLIRRFSNVKNKIFLNLETNLFSIFKLLESDNKQEKYILIGEMAKAIEKFQCDAVAQIFLIENVINLIWMPKTVPNVMVVLEKKRSQEDYIKGNMKNNPYSASEIGESFKQIRMKLYRELELSIYLCGLL